MEINEINKEIKVTLEVCENLQKGKLEKISRLRGTRKNLENYKISFNEECNTFDPNRALYKKILTIFLYIPIKILERIANLWFNYIISCFESLEDDVRDYQEKEFTSLDDIMNE
jgi:hypothetical protein